MKKQNLYLLISIISIILIAGLFSAIFVLNNKSRGSIYLAGNTLLPIDLAGVLTSVGKADNPQEISEPQATIPVIKLLFVGDVMLDRNVFKKTKLAGDYNHPFSLLVWPDEYDFKIANLEGPITDNRSIVTPQNLTFTFSPLFLNALKNSFDIVDLANNHTNNFGEKGLNSTRDYLDKNDIGYFGDPYNTFDKMVKVIEKDGIEIALVGFNQLANKGFDNLLEAVNTSVSQADFVIAFPHWGIEYSSINPGEVQKKQARQIIDAGADLIIGTHPHVVQPVEEYKGKFIFYSLGNFIFDQYFSKETMSGLAISLELVKINEIIKQNFRIYPIDINKESQAKILLGEERLGVLQEFSKHWLVSTSTKDLLLK